ncbi:alpha/beta hydrolase [Corynebacterium hylobatis]|uniref:Alpha/beta hydrolase n=1 Tax=Corynebacterium hylobatis TaxID=1859290 RepID=A0A3S0AWB3_9CORY|nr:alpha/beta hydrolase [Corynebacterium hylobatis]RSZ63523.1 alpha/beta hydrolase [Corynebacterium hylobatis]
MPGRLPSWRDYAAFLPEGRRRQVAAPTTQRWMWRGHDVRILRRGAGQAPVRVLLVHGGGGHAEALWPLASLIRADVADLAAVDLPLYGSTLPADPAAVRYDDWVGLLVDFIATEDDGRPLVLLGASMGGLLSVETAERSGRVAAAVVTCLLDPADWRARLAMARFGLLGVLGAALPRRLPGPLAHRLIPMNWVADLGAMSRDPGLTWLCATDPRGGGVQVPVDFLASYLRYPHTRPEQVETPVLLAHPARDDWTPAEISVRWLRRSPAQAGIRLLAECGHFPVEEPGLGHLIEEVEQTCLGLVAD